MERRILQTADYRFRRNKQFLAVSLLFKPNTVMKFGVFLRFIQGNLLKGTDNNTVRNREFILFYSTTFSMWIKTFTEQLIEKVRSI